MKITSRKKSEDGARETFYNGVIHPAGYERTVIKMNKLNITVIGGGSVNWMRGLMRDVYMLDEADGGEIRLVDPQTHYCEAVAEMLAAFNRIRHKDYRVRITADRREALPGSDFVMCTFSPGSLDAFWNDLEIPIKYGIRLPVSMTVGIPGISAALRTAPVAFEIVRDMEELCPDAWLLNVTNPMTSTIKAMNLARKKVRIVGMCHEFHALPELAGPILGLHKPEGMDVCTYLYKWLPENGFDYTVAGINHFIWLTKARLNGEDVLGRIRDYCRTHVSLAGDTAAGNPSTNVFRNTSHAKFALCRQFGYLPLAGDRHLVEFYPSLCNIRNGFGMKYDVHKTTVDYRRLKVIENLSEIRDTASGQRSVSWKKSGEEMTEIIRAVITGTRTTAIVNAPNIGQISNLPRGAIVETLSTVSGDGLAPRMSGELPAAIGSLCRLHTDIHELTVKAALNGDRDLLIQAMSLDPSGTLADFSEIPQLAEDLLNANRKWLPRFFD